jgi:hypothetical protein
VEAEAVEAEKIRQVEAQQMVVALVELIMWTTPLLELQTQVVEAVEAVTTEAEKTAVPVS